MPEIKKREVAHKIRIGDLLKSNPIFEESDSLNKRLLFVELGQKRIVRVNILANVIDKYSSEGEKRFASITMDDGSGQIRARLFGEDIAKFDSIMQGDTLMIIGLVRSFNQELYIFPEIIRKQDPRYLLVRKLEIEKDYLPFPAPKKQEIKALREQVLELIRNSEKNEGIDSDEIVMKINSQPPLITQEIKKLIEEGLIYEPKPGKLRYLG
ncbi:MAG: OB-fold nucleic acid binding domain-containing protein [Candidatus Nanoarchaeia archaeon]